MNQSRYYSENEVIKRNTRLLKINYNLHDFFVARAKRSSGSFGSLWHGGRSTSGSLHPGHVCSGRKHFRRHFRIRLVHLSSLLDELRTTASASIASSHGNRSGLFTLLARVFLINRGFLNQSSLNLGYLDQSYLI